jgi:hypothetical protein
MRSPTHYGDVIVYMCSSLTQNVDIVNAYFETGQLSVLDLSFSRLWP